MRPEHKPAARLRCLSPSFLWKDYSPYQCAVSANREDYNLRARLIHLQNLVKTWINTGHNPFVKPVECRACLFDTRIPNIYIGRDGLCNMCMTYRRNFKPEVLVGELDAFLRTPKEEGAAADAVVAFSGGKDSTVSLYLARKRFGLHVVAVLVDNGFIPDAVIQKGRAFCDRLDVELVIRKIPFAPHVKRMMDDDFRNGYPCYQCTRMFHAEIQRYGAQNRINRVILGRNWWRWLEPEVRAVRWTRYEDIGLEMQFLSLPFALRLTEHAVKRILSDAGWSPVEIHGNSTNCLIPGLVEHRVYQRIGYHPELNLLSRQVIAGYLSKDEAKGYLADIKDSDGALRQLVRDRLAELEAHEAPE
jgi:predicted PP-loop superfamily ATPase